jgi:hypothetical protein
MAAISAQPAARSAPAGKIPQIQRLQQQPLCQATAQGYFFGIFRPEALITSPAHRSGNFGTLQSIVVRLDSPCSAIPLRCIDDLANHPALPTTPAFRRAQADLCNNAPWKTSKPMRRKTLRFSALLHWQSLASTALSSATRMQKLFDLAVAQLVAIEAMVELRRLLLHVHPR